MDIFVYWRSLTTTWMISHVSCYIDATWQYSWPNISSSEISFIKGDCILNFYKMCTIYILIICFLFNMLILALQPSSATSIWIPGPPTSLSFYRSKCVWNNWWRGSPRNDMDTSYLSRKWSQVYSDGITEKRHQCFSISWWHNYHLTEVRY